ncbi:pyridoxamine 5'-phosphate oxidase family protein [Candidatus Entotheonella palauensis]|uniref:pyridoxamine 5'-phosphate oxidase family protein n=1 Tax=Candidatus Entotheonella palauensis TaxID=93172 RepID=UPI000B7FC9F4|nr:pyridoxamine 5'-phosphate oxidase family protein [Candidatus Entotheonella palauensis]
MGILTDDMKRVIAEQKIGYVATVCADGTPNLSPKATMLVLDDDHIMFADIRSPNTAENLACMPVLEMNFIDLFSRKGYRFKGTAQYAAQGTPAYGNLLPHFEPWCELCSTFRGIITVAVERALPVTSPAYDRGATEEGLRPEWQAYYLGLAETSGHSQR